MKMPIGNAPAVITEYANSAIIPAAEKKGGLLPFAVGIAAGLVAKQAPAMIERYMSALKALGVVDDGNRLDVDLLRDEALKALEAHPVVIAGYSPDKTDIDALYEIMKRYSE